MPRDPRRIRPSKAEADSKLDGDQTSSYIESVAEYADTQLPGDVDQLDAATVEAAADEALATNEIVTVGAYAVVPDVIMAEAAANGHDDPPATLHLVRCDGRVVHLYAMPAEVAS